MRAAPAATARPVPDLSILLAKLLLAPGSVAAITLAVRRFGPRIGGSLGGLPVVAGPILLIYAMQHGTAFAAEAASNSLVALAGLAAFLVVVVGTGRRYGAVSSVVLGWLAFLAVGVLVAWLSLPPVLGLGVACGSFAAALRLIPEPEHAGVVAPHRPRHDLLLRAGIAAAMVLALTSAAGGLGPFLSGVLAPFPTITSVLAGFAVAHEAWPTVLDLLRNMLRGFFSFAAFLFIVTTTVDAWGTAPAFLAAIAVTVVVQVVLIRLAEARVTVG